MACDPRLTAELKAEPPVRGAIVQPATEAERFDTAAFLEGEAEAREWGREGWARAKAGHDFCKTVNAPPK